MRRGGAPCHTQDAHAPGDLAAAQLLALEDMFDTALQRPEHPVQEARLDFRQMLLHRKQGIKLGGVEP